MALQLIAVAALALFLAVRERALRADQRRLIARLREDPEVADLETIFDREWE